MKELTRQEDKRGFGISEIIGIAVVLLIAAIVVIPGLRSISETIMTQLTAWVNTMLTKIFIPSP